MNIPSSSPSHPVSLTGNPVKERQIMKTNTVFRFWSASAAVLLPLLNGCTQQSANNTPVYPTTTTSVPAPVVVQPTTIYTTPPPAAIAEAAPGAEPLIMVGTNATVSDTNLVATAEPVTPTNLRVSKALGEVIHLAQSGVEESIMLTYVTNSPAAFLLGAEEIVYLKDLGVSSSVITSMMQRDQTLKQQWGIAEAAPTTASVVPITNPPTVAAATSYVNPPQPVTVVESQPAYVSNDYFNDSLSPYGTWVEIDGYGRCWRPTISIRSAGWRPYCDGGRWVYTDSGWFWMSDYSWGSVAFHYGRWFSHPRWGWCWWPDRVWAPSWVSWRYDNDNCGWAPLPPNSIYTPGVGFTYFGRSVGLSFDFHLGAGAFTFVPWGRFCDPHPYRYSLPQPRSVAIYTGTTIVNNFDRGSNNRVENRGIPAERVREHARVEVRTVKIREQNVHGFNPRPDHIEGSGHTLVVQRPILPPQPAIAAPGRTAPRSIETPRNNEPRHTERPAAIAIQNPTPHSAPATPATVRPAAVPIDRNPRIEDRNDNRSREGNATVVRMPESAIPKSVPTPTPVTRPTPIFSKPLVVETRPQISPAPEPTTPAPTPAPTVIGNGRNSTGGRDYSVWSNPTPKPAPISSGVAPTQNNAPARSRAGNETTPQPSVTSPAVNAEVNRTRELTRQQEIVTERVRQMDRERATRSRSEDRSSGGSLTTQPAVRAATPPVVINPTPAPTPRPTYTPPAPTPAPAPAPAQVAPRTPTQSAPTRSESRQDSGNDSGRGSRNR